ncbi:MAG TPA: LuxR C-terminal-related transcriptional regulator [Polyangia bacterium]|jgi:DNA-binding CsgD family transcriptional regulator
MRGNTPRTREIATLVEIAVAVRDRDEFRAAALERLQRVIGFDSAVLTSPPSGNLATINKAAALQGAYLAARDRYRDELDGLTRVTARLGGAALGDQILPAPARDRSRFYDEIVRPQGISSLLLGVLAVRGCAAGRVFLARHGRTAPRFRVRERTHLRGLLAALALGDGLDRRRGVVAAPALRPSAPAEVDWTTLSARELELVDFVARGWRNPEIALALGTSRFTVRNQLASVFRKCGATTRTELVRLAVDGGLIVPAPRPGSRGGGG